MTSVFVPCPEPELAATDWDKVSKTLPRRTGGEAGGPSGLPFIPRVAHPFTLRRKWTPIAEWEGRKVSWASSIWWLLWLVWVLERVPVGSGRVRPEDGVELVSVLLVVSVTSGTSLTYLLMAGPEDLVEGLGQLDFPESSSRGGMGNR